MDFEPNEAQQLVRQTARAFAERELAPRAQTRDREAVFPEAEMRALGALGLLGVAVPAAYGGSEQGSLALSLALTEIARVDASVAVTMSVTNMVAEIVARFGGEEARRRLLPGLCAGEAVAGAFALSESQAGSDPGGMTTTARPGGAGWILSGAKLWTTSGDRAGVMVVMAKTQAVSDSGAGKRAISAFVLDPRGLRGFSVGRHEEKMGLRGSTTVALSFDEVELPAWSLLGQLGDGFKIALAALDGGRIGIASQAVGIARAAQDAALRYSGERRQFGRPLRDFQAVQFMLADSATALEAARLLTLRAAWLKERGQPFTREAAEAKLFASERAYEICDRAIQIHGGYGYTREFPVERHMRDVRVTTIYEGTSQIQRIVIARNVLRSAGAAA